MAKKTDRKKDKKAKKAGKQGGQRGKEAKAKKSGAKRSASPGVQEEPKSPMPAQHQEKPGIESEVEPRPRYEAPLYKGSGKLQDKVALITGGDSGIGRAVAVLFAREGADVSIVYLREEQADAEETLGAVEREGRRALLVAGDVRDSKFCREAVEQTVREFGRLDMLVNNAAFQQHQEKLEDVSEEQWDRTFR